MRNLDPGLTFVPAGHWQGWAEIADLFAGPADPDWEADRDELDAEMRDPWAARVSESSPVERAILDTSVVIAEGIERLPGALAISAVTLAELNFGVLVAKTMQVRAERLRRLGSSSTDSMRCPLMSRLR
jgi:hypothetical protein